ncbi:hypothetical protein MTP99_011479 [Tenebrio molitor]|nr:hypothetical protein MTP99_011479 [Tenebrio molitor]
MGVLAMVPMVMDAVPRRPPTFDRSPSAPRIVFVLPPIARKTSQLKSTGQSMCVSMAGAKKSGPDSVPSQSQLMVSPHIRFPH